MSLQNGKRKWFGIDEITTITRKHATEDKNIVVGNI